MKTIYIVMGKTGEYDDFQDWIVKAYSDKGKAEEHAKNARLFAFNLFHPNNKNSKYAVAWDAREENNPHDSKMCIDYTGTQYFVTELELEE